MFLMKDFQIQYKTLITKLQKIHNNSSHNIINNYQKTMDSFTFIVDIQYIQLNLPKQKCFLKFIVKNINRQIQSSDQIKLTQRTRKSILDEHITFTINTQYNRLIDKNIAICVVGISQQYVVFLGLVKINLMDAINSGENTTKSPLQYCKRQNGYLIYKINHVKQQSGKNSQILYNRFRIEESKNQKRKIYSEQSSNDNHEGESVVIHEYNIENYAQNLKLTIEKYRQENQLLKQQNRQLKEQLQIKNSQMKEDQSSQIINKLSSKYEQCLSENIELKQYFQKQIEQFQYRITQLEKNIENFKIKPQEEIQMYVLRQKLKNQQTIKKIIFSEIYQIKKQIEDINYENNFSNQSVKTLQPQENNGNDINLLENQIKILRKVNEFLKSQLYKKSIIQYFKQKQLNMENIKSVLLSTLSEINLKSILKQFNQIQSSL